MSPLFLLNGKILVKDGALASSQNCCCNNCQCPTGTYFCSCLDVDGMKIGSFPGTIHNNTPSGVDVECGALGPNGENGWKITYNGAEIFLTSSASGCCPPNGTYTLSDDTTTITLYDPIAPPCNDPEVKCLPIKWQLYDTTNSKPLDAGNIVKQNDTTYILENLEETFIPWGYYSKTFNVELRISCEEDFDPFEVLETWEVNIGTCGNNRYPEHSYGTWTRKLCKYEGPIDPCLYDVNGDVIEISLIPGAKTRSGNVNTYVRAVPNNYDYSNIFNWTGGTYNIDLPTSSTDVFIAGSCLEDGSGDAKCKNLTIDFSSANGGVTEFGITITANGRVLVNGGVHVIDEKYNTVCSDPIGRGHIVCNNTGNVSTIELSDGITYEYDGDIIFRNSESLLSGTLEYTGTNKVAATFDHTSYLSDNATIIGGDHIFLKGTATIAPLFGFSGGIYNSKTLLRAAPIYDGKWIFTANSSNFGTASTSKYVRFFNNSTNSNSWGGSTPQPGNGSETWGIVTTDAVVHFYDSSSNQDGGTQNFPGCGDYAIVTNDATFHNTAFNTGKVGGDAEFYDSSYYICGTIVGSIDFYNTSYVKARAGSTLTNDDIEFWDTSYNQGTINGDPIFNENSYNDTTGIINGTPKFYDDSSTFGTITSTSGTVNFYNRASIQNGTVNGNCSFVNNSFLWKGTVNGDCSFADYAGCGANFLPPSGPWLYNGGGGVCVAIVNGNTTFANNTLNNGCIRVPDNGSCVFSDSSANNGGYITKADGVGGSNNSLYSVIFNDTSRNGVSRTTDVYGGNVTFNSGTGNGYPGVGAYVSAYNVVFNGTGSIGSVQNYGYVTGSNSVSMTYGYNNPSASITGPTTLTNSENSTGATITGNTSFISSKNYGTVTGDADFDSTSCNSGTVTGAITGNPPAC